MTELATWFWKARDESGALRSGATPGVSAMEVAARLRAEGKVVLGIDRSAGANVAGVERKGVGARVGRRVRRQDVLEFSRQISVMLDAGVPLTEALEAFATQSSGLRIAADIEQIRHEVAEGEPLSVTFGRRPRVFPPVATGLIRAAEAVGDLPGMFTRLADWIGREQRIVRQVRSALAYPAVLAVVGTVITLFLVTMVLPRFEAIYASRAAELPPITVTVLSIGRFITSDWVYWVPGIAAIAAFLVLSRDSEVGLAIRERARFELPVIKSICAPAETGRAFRTWSILLASGVPLLDAVSICRELSPWRRWATLWDGVEMAAKEGRAVSDALCASPLVAPSARAMVAAGEKGGRLPQTLAIIADQADEDLDVAVKRTSTLVEPLAIILLGSVVGVVAIALLLPVFRMSSLAGG